MSRRRRVFWSLVVCVGLGLVLGIAWVWGGHVSDPDLNNDGRVDRLDVSLVVRCLGKNLATAPLCRCADTNDDGVVDHTDLRYVTTRLGRSGYPKGSNPCINTPPVAHAGPDQTVVVGTPVQLDGSRSSDQDGHALRFTWTFVARPAGSQATLSDPHAVLPTLRVDRPGTYALELVVHDGHEESEPDTVVISTENSRPIANAGPDQTVVVGTTVQLDGSGSRDVDRDPDGRRDDGGSRDRDRDSEDRREQPDKHRRDDSDEEEDALTYTWTLLDRPVGSTAVLPKRHVVNPTFVADKPGTYTVELVVHDEHRDSKPDTVVISTHNSRPVVNAGSDQTAFVGATVPLDGSGSSDVDGDPLTYQWSFTKRPEGSTAVLLDPTAVDPSFVPDLPGLYVVQLIVNDGMDPSDPDTAMIAVTVSDCLPGTQQACYSGPAGTMGVGICRAGTRTCRDDGTFDACLGQVWPGIEVCGNALDENCNGRIDDPDVCNDPPVIILPPIPQPCVGEPFSYMVEASDPGDVLTFSLPIAPLGMTIDAVTGLIQWTPTAAQVGSHDVTVIVQDTGGHIVAQSFVLTVCQPNRPPLITSIPVTPAIVGQLYSYDVEATDPDAGDVLTFALPTALAGMTIDPSTGLIPVDAHRGAGGRAQRHGAGAGYGRALGHTKLYRHGSGTATSVRAAAARHHRLVAWRWQSD